MIKEIRDSKSGAILFKKDPETLRYEEVLTKLSNLEKEVTSLKKKVAKLEKESK